MIAERLRPALLYAGSIALGLAAWEIGARNVSRILLAPPSEVLVRLHAGFDSGVLTRALLASLAEMGLGLAIAVAIALPLGLLIGRSRVAADVLEPVIGALYAIPPVAFIPIIIVWCGFQDTARISLVVLMSVFEMLFAFAGGARNIPPGLLDVGRSFGASKPALVRKVMIPAMLPFLVMGLRLGVVRAIHGMIVAQLLFAAAHLGAFMKRAATRFDSAGVLAVIVLLAVLGLVLQEAFKLAERRLFPQRRAAS